MERSGQNVLGRKEGDRMEGGSNVWEKHIQHHHYYGLNDLGYRDVISKFSTEAMGLFLIA